MSQVQDFSGQEQMIQQQIVDRGIKDPRVIAAMRLVPRERFFRADDRRHAYSDRATPIGHGQTISQPYIVALMTQSLQVGPEHKVLEIGTGSGYQTALLSKLAGEVWSIERLKPLLDTAWEKLMETGCRNVHFRHGDGLKGWPQAAPFDRILIAAGAPELPRRLLLDQLADGGVAVLPVGATEEQMLVQVTRNGTELKTVDLCPCRFVKLIGEGAWSEADVKAEKA